MEVNNKMPEDKEPGKNPNWDSIQRDVERKLTYLKGAWNCTAKNKELHKRIFNDIYLPNLKLLGEFCANIKETEEDE